MAPHASAHAASPQVASAAEASGSVARKWCSLHSALELPTIKKPDELPFEVPSDWYLEEALVGMRGARGEKFPTAKECQSMLLGKEPRLVKAVGFPAAASACTSLFWITMGIVFSRVAPGALDLFRNQLARSWHLTALEVIGYCHPRELEVRDYILAALPLVFGQALFRLICDAFEGDRSGFIHNSELLVRKLTQIAHFEIAGFQLKAETVGHVRRRLFMAHVVKHPHMDQREIQQKHLRQEMLEDKNKSVQDQPLTFGQQDAIPLDDTQLEHVMVHRSDTLEKKQFRPRTSSAAVIVGVTVNDAQEERRAYLKQRAKDLNAQGSSAEQSNVDKYKELSAISMEMLSRHLNALDDILYDDDDAEELGEEDEVEDSISVIESLGIDMSSSDAPRDSYSAHRPSALELDLEELAGKDARSREPNDADALNSSEAPLSSGSTKRLGKTSFFLPPDSPSVLGMDSRKSNKSVASFGGESFFEENRSARRSRDVSSFFDDREKKNRSKSVVSMSIETDDVGSSRCTSDRQEADDGSMSYEVGSPSSPSRKSRKSRWGTGHMSLIVASTRLELQYTKDRERKEREALEKRKGEEALKLKIVSEPLPEDYATRELYTTWVSPVTMRLDSEKDRFGLRKPAAEAMRLKMEAPTLLTRPLSVPILPKSHLSVLHPGRPGSGAPLEGSSSGNIGAGAAPGSGARSAAANGRSRRMSVETSYLQDCKGPPSRSVGDHSSVNSLVPGPVVMENNLLPTGLTAGAFTKASGGSRDARLSRSAPSAGLSRQDSDVSPGGAIDRGVSSPAVAAGPAPSGKAFGLAGAVSAPSLFSGLPGSPLAQVVSLEPPKHISGRAVVQRLEFQLAMFRQESFSEVMRTTDTITGKKKVRCDAVKLRKDEQKYVGNMSDLVGGPPLRRLNAGGIARGTAGGRGGAVRAQSRR